MENVVKALQIAGGMMFTILVVTLLIYNINIYSENIEEKERLKATEELTKFNLQFTNFARDDVMGYELLSLVNKVIDYNQRESEAGASTGSAAGNYYQYTPITLKINFKSIDITSYADLFEALHSTTRTKVDIPEIGPTWSGSYNTYKQKDDDLLFKENSENTNGVYTQNNTTNHFKSILDDIDDIEEKYTKSGAQALAKSIGSIFEGKVIGYNGMPPDSEIKQWYQKSYIEEKFKPLTNLNKNIDEIRSDDVIKDILQYNEYMQFKKAKFKCTEVNYNPTSNRVDTMVFQYTGEDLE